MSKLMELFRWFCRRCRRMNIMELNVPIYHEQTMGSCWLIIILELKSWIDPIKRKQIIRNDKNRKRRTSRIGDDGVCLALASVGKETTDDECCMIGYYLSCSLFFLFFGSRLSPKRSQNTVPPTLWQHTYRFWERWNYIFCKYMLV